MSMLIWLKEINCLSRRRSITVGTLSPYGYFSVVQKFFSVIICKQVYFFIDCKIKFIVRGIDIRIEMSQNDWVW